MSYLDDELARIEKYIAGLGIKLTKLTSRSSGSFACWSPGNIHLFINEHKTKTDLLLTLLHELAHNMYYVHNNKVEIPDEFLLDHNNMTKSQRKVIYDYEANGISYMSTIAIELGLKIPHWKVILNQELDLWVYKSFYENGKYPTTKEKKLKKKELTKLYKGKK